MCAKRAYKALFFTICENIISNWLCKIFRLIYVRYAGFPRSLRSLGMTYGRFGFYPLVIARSNECCDVAIKATAAFRYAGFPRSLCSLGMTKGRFGFVFPLVIARSNKIATWQSRRQPHYSFAKSTQFGFRVSMRASFFFRDQLLICFSRAIASSAEFVSST